MRAPLACPSEVLRIPSAGACQPGGEAEPATSHLIFRIFFLVRAKKIGSPASVGCNSVKPTLATLRAPQLRSAPAAAGIYVPGFPRAAAGRCPASGTSRDFTYLGRRCGGVASFDRRGAPVLATRDSGTLPDHCTLLPAFFPNVMGHANARWKRLAGRTSGRYGRWLR